MALDKGYSRVQNMQSRAAVSAIELVVRSGDDDLAKTAVPDTEAASVWE